MWRRAPSALLLCFNCYSLRPERRNKIEWCSYYLFLIVQPSQLLPLKPRHLDAACTLSPTLGSKVYVPHYTSMARDGRKRGYSQAFQLMMNAVPNRRAQIPRTMTASALSEASTPLEFAWCNKENEKPFDNDMYSPFLDSPATPPPSFCWPADLKPFPLPPPQVKVQPDEPRPLQTLIQIPYKNTPSSKLSSSPIGRSSFRPALALGSSPSDKGSILDMPSTGPGPTIFEDNIAMSGSSWFGLPLTPSELPMQDLSLGSDPVCPLPALPTLRKIPRDRTTVHIGSVSDWYTYVLLSN